MRYLRNVSISLKLAISAAMTLALLAALGFTCQDSLARLAALQTRASRAAASVERLGQAQRAGLELRVISRDIAQQQTTSGLKELAERATAQAARARRNLSALAEDQQAGAEERSRIVGALMALDGFAKVIDQEFGAAAPDDRDARA